MKKVILITIIIFCFVFWANVQVKAESVAERSAGRILLQVESHGEAWYVNPDNLRRYYLGRPEDAFRIMREQGVGITNNDLNKIPIGLSDNPGEDSDGDGLSDSLEEAVGTDKNKKDSDNDSYSDKSEVENNYNPLGTGKLLIDNNFSLLNSGKIFLQVESHGEAWYINPEDNHRYFLGRPLDAFNIMRNFGLGITNTDLEKIVSLSPESVSDSDTLTIEKIIFELVNQERVNKGLAALAWNEEVAAVAREHSENLAEENKGFTGSEISCDYPMIHHEGSDFGIYHSERLNNREVYYYSSAGENIALYSRGIIKVIYRANDPILNKIYACEEKREGMDEQFNKALEEEENKANKLEIIKEEIKKRTEEFKKESKATILEIEWFTDKEIASGLVGEWMNSLGHKENITNEDYDEAGIGIAYINNYIIVTQVFIKRAECGYETGTCCEKKGYFPYCFIPLECSDNVCE